MQLMHADLNMCLKNNRANTKSICERKKVKHYIEINLSNTFLR